MSKWLDPITAARADLEMDVSRLREENAKLREVDEWRCEQLRKAQERIRAAEAEASGLKAFNRALVSDDERRRADAFERRDMDAPEDSHVEALCKRYGYGAVMDAASRLWARKDSRGAFYIGGCIGLSAAPEHRDMQARSGK